MTADDYEARTMTRSEVDFAIGLAAEEGWNPGIHDAECFYAADPTGFLIGLLDGEPISSISVVKYGDTFGFLGLYIVRPEYRDRGFGFEIWKEGMKRFENRDVGLDGVLEMEADYAKSGFEFAHLNTRYRGEAVGDGGYSTDPRIIELSEIPFEYLKAYDDSLFPASRPEFLRYWISRAQSIALGIMEDGQLAGYTVLRQCRAGYKIGPLFAEDEMLAEALFQALSMRVAQGTRIFLDVPGTRENAAATTLARRHAMTAVYETVRMYRMQTTEEMSLPLNHWFGVTSFELG